MLSILDRGRESDGSAFLSFLFVCLRITQKLMLRLTWFLQKKEYTTRGSFLLYDDPDRDPDLNSIIN